MRGREETVRRRVAVVSAYEQFHKSRKFSLFPLDSAMATK